MARDYRAEYERRKARGAAKGLRPSDAAGQRARSARQIRRQPRDTVITVGRRRMEVVNSADRKYVMRRVRQAARENKNAVIYVVWPTEDGGYATQVFGGKAKKHASARLGDRSVGKMRVMIATPATMDALAGVKGVPARQVADALKIRGDDGEYLYDSIDDYLGDWWDDEEGEYGDAGVPAGVGAPASSAPDAFGGADLGTF